jgi:hypothetical protein
MTYWRPPVLSRRMPAQLAFHLWSEVYDRGWSSLGTAAAREEDSGPISRPSDEFAAIAVSPAFKQHMQLRWREVLGFSDQALFPDLDGFANTHAASQEIPWDFFHD